MGSLPPTGWQRDLAFYGVIAVVILTSVATLYWSATSGSVDAGSAFAAIVATMVNGR